MQVTFRGRKVEIELSHGHSGDPVDSFVESAYYTPPEGPMTDAEIAALDLTDDELEALQNECAGEIQEHARNDMLGI